jgi:hypothetical protein
MKAKRTPAEIAADKNRTGRPRDLPELKAKLVAIRVTKSELAQLRKTAKARGITLSEAIMAPHRQKQGK